VVPGDFEIDAIRGQFVPVASTSRRSASSFCCRRASWSSWVAPLSSILLRTAVSSSACLGAWLRTSPNSRGSSAILHEPSFFSRVERQYPESIGVIVPWIPSVPSGRHPRRRTPNWFRRSATAVSSGHQGREARLVQDRTSNATEHPLVQVGVAIGAHDEEIGAESGGLRQ